MVVPGKAKGAFPDGTSLLYALVGTLALAVAPPPIRRLTLDAADIAKTLEKFTP